jgi:hypothetical protein
MSKKEVTSGEQQTGKIREIEIIKEQGFGTETLAAALDYRFGNDKFENENDGTKKLSDSFKKSARVAANVPYVIKALKEKDSNVSDLNVSQIQLAAMFLDGVESDGIADANKQNYSWDNEENLIDGKKDKSIKAFKEFAEANKKQYGFDDEGITKLTNAMHKFQTACIGLGPNGLEKPLVQVLYVSNLLDSLGNKDIIVAEMVKQRIEKVVGPDQGSSLIKRSEMAIKETSDQDFEGGSKELCKKVYFAHLKVRNEELEKAGALQEEKDQKPKKKVRFSQELEIEKLISDLEELGEIEIGQKKIKDDSDAKYLAANDSSLDEKNFRTNPKELREIEIKKLKDLSDLPKSLQTAIKKKREDKEQIKTDANNVKNAMDEALKEFKKNKKVTDDIGKNLKEKDSDRFTKMKEAHAMLEKFDSADQDTLDEAKKLFIENAEKNTGRGWSKQTATLKKFNQKLKEGMGK